MRLKRKFFSLNRETFLLPLLLMLLCCFGGILLGQVYANRISESVILEIKSYLKNYICLDSVRDDSAEAFFSTFWGYFRYPLLSYLVFFHWNRITTFCFSCFWISSFFFCFLLYGCLWDLRYCVVACCNRRTLHCNDTMFFDYIGSFLQ